jgi:hypothetical protein
LGKFHPTISPFIIFVKEFYEVKRFMHEPPVGGTHESMGFNTFVGFLESLGGEEGGGLTRV